MFTALTNQGRSAIAQAVKDEELFMAWGPGESHWDTDRQEVGEFDVDNHFDVGYTELKDFVLTKADDDDIVYVLNTDYTVNLLTGIVTKLPGGSIAGDDVKASFHVKPPQALRTDTDLVSELARRRILVKQFVLPDPEGEIITNYGTYTVSLTPTPWLHISCTFLPADDPTATIRQIGIFTGTEIETGLPGGQTYFTPAQIEERGTLFSLRNLPTINRTAASKETFDLVIPF